MEQLRGKILRGGNCPDTEIQRLPLGAASKGPRIWSDLLVRY